MQRHLGLLLGLLSFGATRAAPEDAAPAYLPYSLPNTGGIEVIRIGGKRHYFGFNYSDDRVLSPLFDGGFERCAGRPRTARAGIDPSRCRTRLPLVPGLAVEPIQVRLGCAFRNGGCERPVAAVRDSGA